MQEISAHDVCVGDKVMVRLVHPRTGSITESTLKVARIVDGFLVSPNLEDSEGCIVATCRTDVETTVFLIEREPDLAREMLDVYNATEGNRMVRMRALVDQLGLIKREANASQDDSVWSEDRQS